MNHILNRREVIRYLGTGGAVAVIGPSVLLQTGCGPESKKQLAKWSITGLQVLGDISPILTEMGATEIVTLIDKAVPYAEKLKKAFEDNDNTSAGQLLESLVGADGWLAKIADAVGLLKDESRKKILLGSLAIAQVAYRLISAQIQNDVPQAVADAASKSRPKATAAIRSAAAPDKLELAFQATRF